MARAALRIGVRELAALAETSAPTVCRHDNGKHLSLPILDRI
jgi:hypothetical protein